jgi:hypothetical protein
MSRLTEDQWGIEFDVTELEAAISLSENLGLPWVIAHEHEGCPDVFEVPRVTMLRDARRSSGFTDPPTAAVMSCKSGPPLRPKPLWT